jgi:hypothetical protein
MGWLRDVFSPASGRCVRSEPAEESVQRAQSQVRVLARAHKRKLEELHQSFDELLRKVEEE